MSQVVGKSFREYRRGRDALWWGLKHLKIENGDNVLIPATVCGAVIQPLIASGINIKFYSVDKNLKYSLNDIKNLVDSKTKGVLIVHYFGFSQNPELVKNFCVRNNLYLIEDCALSFASRHGGSFLGSFGDISIFSPRKFFPVPDGGYLASNNMSLDQLCNVSSQNISGSSIRLMKLISAYISSRGYFPWRLFRPLITGRASLGSENVNGDFDTSYASPISTLSKWIISKENFSELISKRRENYRFWLAKSKLINDWEPLFPYMGQGVVPYMFPVRINENATEFVNKLSDKGVFIEMPLNLPFYEAKNLIGPANRFNDAEELAGNIIGLPVHQTLTKRMLQSIYLHIRSIYEV